MLIRYLLICILFVDCRNRSQHQPTIHAGSESKIFQWEKLADTTSFKPTGQLQFMNIRDTLWAFHPNGNYFSTNGLDFHLSNLEPIVSAPGGYLFFNNKLLCLRYSERNKNLENLTGVTYTSSDLQYWNSQVTSSTMPFRNSFHPVIFKGKIWIFGGMDSTSLNAGAWNSDDAIHWKKVSDSLEFGLIENQHLIVFKKKILLLSDHLWESEDGIHWKKVPATTVPSLQSSTPILYNGLLWIFGAGFSNGGNGRVLVSADARKWDTISVPWLERKSPAVCIFRGKIIMGGGNHQLISGTVINDSLLNDIWQMEYSNSSQP